MLVPHHRNFSVNLQDYWMQRVLEQCPGLFGLNLERVREFKNTCAKVYVF
jgi:hypothetical protein